VCVCVWPRMCSLYIHITGTPEGNESNQIWGSNTLTPVQQRDVNKKESLYHEPPRNGFFNTKMRFSLNGNYAQLHKNSVHSLKLQGPSRRQ